MAARVILLFLYLAGLIPVFAQRGGRSNNYGILVPSVPGDSRQRDSIIGFFKLADEYMDLDRYDSAEYWLAKAGDRLGFKQPGIFNYYFHSRQAEIFYYNNLLQLGFQQASRALQIAHQLNDSLFIADACNFLGLFSINLEKYKDAEKYLRKGLLYMGGRNTPMPAIALSETYHLHGNLGEAYTRMGRYDKALLHFDSSRTEAALKKARRAEALALISAGDALLETGNKDSSGAALAKGIQLALQQHHMDVALYGYGVLAGLHAMAGNATGARSSIEKGNQLLQNETGLNPYYSLLYLRKAAAALGRLKDYKAMADMQGEIMKTELSVRRKNNLMIEDVLSAGLRNENKLLQMEVNEARRQQRESNVRIMGLLVIIGLLVLSGLFYRNSIRQKLMLAGIRDKISRNLHDDIGASISSLSIYSSIAQQTLYTNPGKTNELLGKITRQSGLLMENMSDIVWSMKAHGEEGMSLGTRIKNFGSELLTVQNIQCRYNIDEDAFRLFGGYESRKNILLILKEAMNNIAKYSGASQALVELKRKDTRSVLLVISDNGAGFEVQKKTAGNGLKHMQARVKELKGHFEIVSRPGKGTTIRATIPIP